MALWHHRRSHQRICVATIPASLPAAWDVATGGHSFSVAIWEWWQCPHFTPWHLLKEVQLITILY